MGLRNPLSTGGDKYALWDCNQGKFQMKRSPALSGKFEGSGTAELVLELRFGGLVAVPGQTGEEHRQTH